MRTDHILELTTPDGHPVAIHASWIISVRIPLQTERALPNSAGAHLELSGSFQLVRETYTEVIDLWRSKLP